MKKNLLIATMAGAAFMLFSAICGAQPGPPPGGGQPPQGGRPPQGGPQGERPKMTFVQIDKTQIDLSTLPVDEDGYYVLFNGTDLTGWRTYGKDEPTARWSVDDGCIHFTGRKEGEERKDDGGDLMFSHKFKNFIFECEWMISKGGNSGILYLGQEIGVETPDGNVRPASIVLSAPEYQVLDNENHPDAKLGENGNRTSASLYDLIPADPQNSNGYEVWNTAKITVNNGTVTHSQNGVDVVTYQLWTDEWIDMIQKSKFGEKAWPEAFQFFSNVGGENHEGYIAFQDHNDDVWFRKIRIKILDE